MLRARTSSRAVLLRPQVKQFYTAPTLIRSLMAAGEHHVTPHDRSSLRVLGTVGEPINPEAWRWYHEVCPCHRAARQATMLSSQQ